jgi:hypothetical protein
MPLWSIIAIMYESFCRDYSPDLKQEIEKVGKGMWYLMGDKDSDADPLFYTKYLANLLNWGMRAQHLCTAHYPISKVYGQLQPVRFRKSTGFMSEAHAKYNFLNHFEYGKLVLYANPGKSYEECIAIQKGLGNKF